MTSRSDTPDRIAYLRRVADLGGYEQVRAALTEALDLLASAEADVKALQTALVETQGYNLELFNERDRALADLAALRERIEQLPARARVEVVT